MAKQMAKQMASQKSRKRSFKAMSYAQVQRANSTNRASLKPEHQHWLKENGYKNVGWDRVIALYEKIEEFLDKAPFEEMSLEELFLEADRIGNKYQTPEEINQFNQQFAHEVNEIAELVDQQFPDTEVEFVDFGAAGKKTQKKRQR
jgi:hypothetical protein